MPVGDRVLETDGLAPSDAAVDNEARPVADDVEVRLGDAVSGPG